MKFVEITEAFDTFVSRKGSVTVQVNGYVNIDNIELIRENANGGLLLFLVGRDKSIKVLDKDSVNRILKECKISKKSINENKKQGE